MNNVCLVGRLTKDPELKTTESGKSVTSFCVAVNRKENTDFIDCVAWGKTAEFITRYFQKGKEIGIVGEIRTRTYTANDGKNRKVTEVLASNVSFVGSKSETKSEPKIEVKPLPEPTDDGWNELPF